MQPYRHLPIPTTSRERQTLAQLKKYLGYDFFTCSLGRNLQTCIREKQDNDEEKLHFYNWRKKLTYTEKNNQSFPVTPK